MQNMNIEFLICTIDERISRIESMLLEPINGVSYLISWQCTEDFLKDKKSNSFATPLYNRDDVRVFKNNSKGLSRNRNFALQRAMGDFLVIADDDCFYSLQSIVNIQQAFLTHPDASICLFQASDYKGKPLHNYVDYSYEYKQRPRFTNFSSWEIVLRRLSKIPTFDERFGIGAYLGCGEEEIFLHNASKSGLKIYYEPLLLVKTSAETTGTHFFTSRSVQRAKGGVLTIIHGPFFALLRCVKYAFFYIKTPLIQRLRILLEMIKGIVYVLTHHPLP